MDTIKVGIIGATGYAGEELVRLLYGHPAVKIVNLSSKSYAGQPYSKVYPSYRQLIADDCQPEDLEALSEEADVVFWRCPMALHRQR